MSEGERRLIIVRNGHALVHGSTPTMREVERKESSPLSPAGERQAIAAGTWLKNSFEASNVRELEAAGGHRTRAMAQRVIGETGWGVGIETRHALDHRDIETKVVREKTRGWLIEERVPGIYIAVMSGRAIRAMLQKELGLADKFVDMEPQDLLGPGSVISLHANGTTPEIDLIMEGSMYMTNMEKQLLVA